MPNVIDLAVPQQHFDDIEPVGDFRIAYFSEIPVGGPGEATLLLEINRIGRPGPFFAGPGLHFNERQHVAIAKDEVNLAVFVAKVRGKIFQTALFQMLFGSPFTQFAMPQMLRAIIPKQ